MSRKELIELLTELLGPLSNMVLRQIDKFTQAGLTHKDIARAVYYVFDVLGRDRSSVSTYGIGLVPSVVNDANKYYDNIKRQQEKQAEQMKNIQEVPVRTVEPQSRIRKMRGIKIDEL